MGQPPVNFVVKSDSKPTAPVKFEPLSDPFEIVNATTVEELLYPGGNGHLGEWGHKFSQAIIEPLQPRDPLERMLIEQAIWCHCRAHRLIMHRSRRQGLDEEMLLDALCDKSMASFRKSMLALKEYRSVRRAAPMVAVQQVNQMSAKKTNRRARSACAANTKKMTNELGANNGNSKTNHSQSDEQVEVEGLQQ